MPSPASVASPSRTTGTGAVVVVTAVVAALAAVLVAVVLTGTEPRPSPAGLADAGLLTGWALPLLRASLEVAAVGTVGALLVAAVLAPGDVSSLTSVARRALGTVPWWAGVWALSAAGLVVVTASDVLGLPLGEVVTSPALVRYALDLPEGRALATVALVAFALALYAATTHSRLGAGVLLLLAVGSMTPLLVTGHSATASTHYLATQGLLMHVLAATVWVGGLLGLVLYLRGERQVLAVAVPRFSTIALVCFAVVALSGALTAWTRIGLVSDRWLSAYGALVTAKVTALAALGLLGALHRRHSVARVVAGSRRAFLRLAAVEIAVMGAALGIAAVLSRTAPPPGAVQAEGHGDFASTARELDRFGVWQILTGWDLDALVVTLAVAAAVAYLLGARTLVRRGEDWAIRRTLAALAGLGAAVLLLCSGVGTYAPALLSVQTAQLLGLLTVVPVLLTLGRPVLLVRRLTGLPVHEGTRSRATRIVADPVNALTAAVALVVLVYATPLLDTALQQPAVHLLLSGTTVLVGFWLFWSLLGTDWLPECRPARDRAVLLTVLAALLLGFAVLLWRGGTLYGEVWLDSLQIPWRTLREDQRAAAVVTTTVALALLPLAAVVRTGWRRQPRRTG